MEIKKILYPTDFSEASKNALKYALYMQKMLNAELEIVHVVFDETYLITTYVPQSTLKGFITELEAGASQQFDEFLNESKELDGVKYTKKVLRGTPHIEITKHAEAYKADLIVIGTTGRTGLEHVLFGSTTEKVIGRVKCPVMTIKPQ